MKIVNSHARYAAAVFIIAVAAFFVSVAIINSGDSAVRGVSLGKLPIGAQVQDAARLIAEGAVNDYMQSRIKIKTASSTHNTVRATPSEAGLEFNVTKSLQSAFAYGRNRSLVINILKQARALVWGKDIPLETSANETAYENFSATILKPLHNPAKNASFSFSAQSDEWEFMPASVGVVVDTQLLKNELLKRASYLSLHDIKLEQKTEAPLVYTEGAEEAREQARAYISNMPYVLHAHEKSWEIEKDDLIDWITFTPKAYGASYKLQAAIAQTKIEEYLKLFAPGLNTKPINAELQIENERANSFALSEPGQELAITESAQAIKEMIESSANRTALIFNTIEPSVTTEQINNLGITSLIGRGESDFAGSPKSRAHNIQVGSNKYHGFIIAPNEEFSFNDILGEVTAAEGYLPELVIKKDKTIPEYGGGLCQVSTTLFRAALNAGLKITSRTNHSFPVRYYGTPGLDATIYPPSPDLKFINNTPAHILLQYKIEGTKLTFEIYGKDDGRTTELIGPVVYDKKDDGSQKAWVKQIVRNQEGDTIEDRTFYSNYKSPALYPIERNPLE